MSSFEVDAKYDNLNRTADSGMVPLMLEVTAPATLPAGYKLQVCAADGVVATVVVPMGGVRKGQTFMGSVVSDSGAASTDNGHNVPIGAWRDGTFNCCAQGVCHPLFWMSVCCAPVVLAQVLYRLNLDWTGRPTSRDKADINFMTVVGIFVVYMVIRSVMHSPSTPTNGVATGASSSSGGGYQRIVDFVFLIYFVFVATRARRFIREQNAIPTQCCGESEDCCCSYWCGCCTVGQMARHTADYDRYAAKCCSKSGMAANAPEFV